MPKKVLVVEDDGELAELIAATLRGRGYAVTVASSAEEGVEAARNSAPDIIFVSLLLQGGSNGLKVCKELHGVAGLGKVPVVMLISYAGELDPRHMTTIGVVGVLVKPIKESDIVAAAQRILGAAATPDEMAEMDFGGEDELPAGTGGSDDKSHFELQGSESFSALQAEPPGEAADHGDEPHLSYEIDQTEKEHAPRHPAPESAPAATAFEEADAFGDDVRDEGHGRTKKILMGVAGVMIVAGITFGGLQAKKYFFPSGKASAPARPPVSAKQEPVAVKDNLPAEAKNEPATAAGKGDAAPPKEETSAKKPPQAPSQPKPEAQADPAKTRPQATPPKAQAREKKKAVPAGEAKDAKQAPAAAPKAAVQVGVFAEEKNAVALADRLKKKGFGAYLLKDAVKGKTIFRVLVGRFDDRKKAAVQATALGKEGFKSVIYPPKK